MKFCSQCGTKNDDDARYCNACGNEILSIQMVKATGGKHKTGINKNIWIAIITAFVFAVLGTVWHLKSSGVFSTKKEEKIITPEKSKDKPSSDSDVQKKKGEIADELISDQELGKLPIKPSPLSSSLRDIDNADAYRYKEDNCDKLVTDVGQGIAYSIERELLEVTKISEQEENELGREFANHIGKQFKGKLDLDKTWLSYIQSLGKHLVSNVERKGIEYHFHVISENQVNAFAIPGGGIYFFTGILKAIKNEAQLAEIIAHEAKHIDLRHCIAIHQVLSKLPGARENPIAFSVAQMIRQPYSARAEADADRRGLELIYSFGYSPYQAVSFWQNEMSRGSSDSQDTGLLGNVLGRVGDEIENVLSTHPHPKKRACLLRNHTLKLQAKYPMDRVYVGKSNYESKTPMFKRQM